MKCESDQLNKNAPVAWMTRRKFLAISGTTCCGLALYYVFRGNSAESSATTSVAQLQDKEAMPDSKLKLSAVKEIPQAWIDQKGEDVLSYAKFIQGQDFKNFTAYDVLYPHFKRRGRHRNELPPRYLWAQVVPVLKVIDKMATHMKAKPKPFVSIYRSPKYNRAVRGRARSQHLVNRAVDVQFHGVNSETVAKVARSFRKAGHFKGGVGWHKCFVHIDNRGHNADW